MPSLHQTLPSPLTAIATSVAGRSYKSIAHSFRSWSKGPVTEDKMLGSLMTMQRSLSDTNITDAEELHTAIQDYLDISIYPELLRNDCDEVAARTMKRQGIYGGLMKVIGQDHLTIQVPATLTEDDMADLLAHECTHLILGHAIPIRVLDQPHEAALHFWSPSQCPYPGRKPYDATNFTLSDEELVTLLSLFEQEAHEATRQLRSIFAYQKVNERENIILGL